MPVLQHLTSRPQFQAALAGLVLARTAHFALHHTTAAAVTASGHQPPLFVPATIYLGAMTPKRWARRAVTRNSIRRQIYAVGVASAPRLPCAAYLVRLRREFDRRHFISATSQALKAAVRAELLVLFERALHAVSAPGADALRGGIEAEAA